MDSKSKTSITKNKQTKIRFSHINIDQQSLWIDDDDDDNDEHINTVNYIT